MKPKPSDYPAYFGNYIKYVVQEDLNSALAQTQEQVLALVKTIPAHRENFAYAEGKWSVKQVLMHCMDTERVFAFRAMSFARGEKQTMLSFDENIYADNCDAHLRTLADITFEFDSLMRSSQLLFKSFSHQKLDVVGHMQSGPVTVNAIGYTICGHTLHHLGILKERYLK